MDEPTPKTPLWKNPFLIAFALGVVFLTVLPFMQRLFLKAPPPVATLPAWRVPSPLGGTVGADDLLGRVWLGSFVPAPCDAACVEQQAFFGRALEHLDDLDGGAVLVSFVQPGAEGPVRELAQGAGGQWYVAGGTTAELRPVISALRDAFQAFGGRDAGATVEEFVTLPGFVLVDQTGAVRGFWKADSAGRGNATNAARLLARAAPTP